VSGRFEFIARGGLWLLLCAQLTACPTRDEARPGSSVTVTDGGLNDAPGRMVVEYPPDAAFHRDADLPPIGANEVVRDAGRQFNGDVRIPRDGTGTLIDTAAEPCNVVTQNCGAGKGCYPTPDVGGVKCFPAGSSSQGLDCVDHKQCAPGLLCIEAGDAGTQCVRACDKSRGGVGCLTPDVCHGYDGTVGYCAP
jgi:hypothetical protein